jgi:hypothetical protein
MPNVCCIDYPWHRIAIPRTIVIGSEFELTFSMLPQFWGYDVLCTLGSLQQPAVDSQNAVYVPVSSSLLIFKPRLYIFNGLFAMDISPKMFFIRCASSAGIKSNSFLPTSSFSDMPKMSSAALSS